MGTGCDATMHPPRGTVVDEFRREVEPDGWPLRQVFMETTIIRVRPAPPYEHPAGTDCQESSARSASGPGCDLPVGRRVSSDAETSRLPERASTLAAGQEARRFAIATLRLLFEVADRRRGVAQLAGAASPAIVDRVAVLVRHNAFRGAGGPAPTLVRRVHVQLCHAGAAEIFGVYSTGDRVRAVAGRIERVPCRVRAPQPAPSQSSQSHPAPAHPGLSHPGLARVEYRWQLVDLELA